MENSYNNTHTTLSGNSTSTNHRIQVHPIIFQETHKLRDLSPNPPAPGNCYLEPRCATHRVAPEAARRPSTSASADRQVCGSPSKWSGCRCRDHRRIGSSPRGRRGPRPPVLRPWDEERCDQPPRTTPDSRLSLYRAALRGSRSVRPQETSGQEQAEEADGNDEEGKDQRKRTTKEHRRDDGR